MMVAHVFAEWKSEKYVHVASPVGEIQLKMYCNPSPYHENRFCIKGISGSREKRWALTTGIYTNNEILSCDVA
jgi:hypothetical protein